MKMKKTWILVVAISLIAIGGILQFIYGNMFSTGDYSMNYFAAGDYACGIFAAGKFSIGIFSVGIFSVGIFSLGIFNLGFYAIGLFVLAWKKRLPNSLLYFLKTNSNSIKTTLVMAFVFVLSVNASAQNESKFSLSGGFGGPMINVASVSTSASIAIGGGGAAVFSSGLFIGGFGFETSDMVNAKSKLDNYKLKTEYGGLWLGYISKIGKSYRITGSLKTGFGEAQLINDGIKQTYFDDLIVFTPEIAFSKRFRFSAIELGLFYNIFTGIDFHDHSNNDFSGLGMSLTFKFGGGYF